MWSITRSVLIGLVVIGLLGACSGTGGLEHQGATSIAIAGFLFKPEALDLRAGATITWRNSDDIDHTITSGTPGMPSGIFDSGNRAKGASFSHAFSTRGRFPYFCRNHESMRGEVTVA